MHSDFLFVGTHRRAYRSDPAELAQGIYSFHCSADGALQPRALASTLQPGWLALHPREPLLYAVHEVHHYDEAEGGGVSAFAIDPVSGALRAMNSQRTPALPCHCQVDASGRFLLVASFTGGSIHLFPLLPDGRIGTQADMRQHTGSSVHPRRQLGPHAHAVSIDPANRFVLVPDLGTDQLLVYGLDGAGARLVAHPEHTVRLAPGSGPRHVSFGQEARFVYLMNEIGATITAFAYEADRGALRELQTVDILPAGFAGMRSGAAIAVHPKGGFLYATTRSHTSSGEPPVRGLDSLVWFQIEPASGLLHFAGRIASGGEIPRSFSFDVSGNLLWVGHQASGNIVTFRIDPRTGVPTPIGEPIATPVPVCLCLRASR